VIALIGRKLEDHRALTTPAIHPAMKLDAPCGMNSMSDTSITDQQPAQRSVAVIHPLWLRLVHWINAFAMVVMIGSGWQIYNASPLFDFSFSRTITIGGWLGGALQWHFAAMWLLAINGVLYLVLGIITGRFREKLWPISAAGVTRDLRQAVMFKLSHGDLSRYNDVQKLLYAGVMLAGIVAVLSGMALWKPVQWQTLTALFGGYDVARYVHFFAMTAICTFLLVHVTLALLVPRALRAIILGR
jgi:thiosulfate reductase cytochrome b subunit